MCGDVKRLFDDYGAAVDICVEAEGPQSECRLRTARENLLDHVKKHGCCTMLRFEASVTDRRWNFHLLPPHK